MFLGPCTTNEAFHLNAGFNCTEKCHLCDGTDWENMSRNAIWRRSLGAMRWAPPFHPVPIPLLQIPGMCQETILPDSCHCFHLGWGIDLAASGLVLMVKRRCFQAGTFDKKLELAYKNFTKWCSPKKENNWDWLVVIEKTGYEDVSCSNTSKKYVWIWLFFSKTCYINAFRNNSLPHQPTNTMRCLQAK